jgi:superfamily II DNA or RNA helicase
MNKLKDGKEYEDYILNIIKDKYKFCYLWQDIPCNILDTRFYKDTKICDDIGCDIIGINHDDSIDYIQCKNYSTTGEDNVISICDLAGFYNFVAENSILNSIVYYSGKLSQQIKCRQNKIKYVNLPMIKNTKILDLKPREYQIEAYNKLKDVNRSILSMPCGTGKTFVSFLLSLDYKNVFILTPLISTTEQIFIHYKNYYSSEKDINFTLINCKAERNIANIKLGNKNIIASTYDSCDIILKLLNNTNIEDNLIIIDEFHNISYDMISNEKNKMNQILTSKNKILFISATPFETAKHQNIFGKTVYILEWKTAIDNKYICDYNFYYPNNNKIIERIDNLKIDKSLIEKTILINKAYFLLESIKITNVKKCITYLKTINEMEQFVKILKTINIYFDLNIKVYEITCNTTKKKRLESINKFKNDNNMINILCNVHILNEGIDIPECDSIYLTHPNNNPINIIQRISRANRLDNNNINKITKIFIWSRDKIKLEQIMKNITKIINIKYGIESNEFINEEKVDVVNIVKTDSIMNNILIYNSNNIDYVIDTENNMWFKFINVCNLLEYKSGKDVLRDHVNKEHTTQLKNITLLNKDKKKNDQPATIYINKNGLYSLLIKSKMNKAKEFQSWLINEVFPKSIQFGKYEVDTKTNSKLCKICLSIERKCSKCKDITTFNQIGG